MSTDSNRIRDSFQIALERARALSDGTGVVGFGVLELRDAQGNLKQVEPFANKITDHGDFYYASRGATGINGSGVADATHVTGMKLGTGTTAAGKTDGLQTYLGTGITANKALDSGFPTITNLGSTLGVEITYKVTWAAGQATNAAITEAVICDDSATDATSAAANVISRVVFGAVNKGAADTLAITWNHKFLG